VIRPHTPAASIMVHEFCLPSEVSGCEVGKVCGADVLSPLRATVAAVRFGLGRACHHDLVSLTFEWVCLEGRKTAHQLCRMRRDH